MSWSHRARPIALPLLLALAALPVLAAPPAPLSPKSPPRNQAHAGPAANSRTAIAVLHGAPGQPKLAGTVMFVEEGDHVWVVASVSGVAKPGRYGFHLHEVGRCDRDAAGRYFTSAGGHFNPGGSPHGCLASAAHHAGDFGNLTVEADGTGRMEQATEALALSGPRSVIGRAVILHAGPDDCATQPAGNSGGRMACGVVQPSDAAHPKPAH